MRLQGKVALVTGGGSGIGRAIAARFAEEGARVVVNDIRKETAEATARAIGGQARAIAADVADSAAVRTMIDEIGRTLGGLDVLVNNAGIGEVDGSNREAFAARAQARIGEMMAGKVETHWDVTVALSDAEWARMLAVHLNGTFYCTREALKLMSRVNRGAIVNISSVAGLMGIEVAPHYGAAKAGILGFTRSVAREVATRGIRVNAICPGWIETPILDPLPPMVKMLAERQTPLGRLGEPREIANAALFLASDESSFVTGQWLSPNGGLLTI
ncbi:MAG TPA: SDR family NAD(P)-dependent oxidoreductase [Methylomirabilota bacterium]|nr:SDR family NAD(P)-dependent oxidoreductase [Methylomirabilota bacterium]